MHLVTIKKYSLNKSAISPQLKTPLEILQKAKGWLSEAYDETTRQEVRQLIAKSPEKLIDAFYQTLSFGTGGMRGIMGVGTNRMNRYTVTKNTAGLASYLKKHCTTQPIKVAIGFDARHQSDIFAKITASVLSTNGIEAYMFDELCPTPLLVFAVRYLSCQAGIMITASHNPKQYNGYKVYDANGAQMVSPADEAVLQHINALQNSEAVKHIPNASKIHTIGQAVVEAYEKKILEQYFFDVQKSLARNLHIVYTPLHGTGIRLIPTLLQQKGFKHVTVVAKQAIPDGDFPTVVSPNPEAPEAMQLAVQQAEACNADLAIATDPDADRVRVAVCNATGQMQLLDGNQIGALLTYYVLKHYVIKGLPKGHEYMAKTMVTTPMITKIAAHFQVPCYDTLPGFKYIAEMMRHKAKQFLLGTEESYGYLIGDFISDKDGVGTACMLAEMAAWLKAKGKSMYTLLVELYQQFGYYQTHIHAITQTGPKGAMFIKATMRYYRQIPVEILDGQPIVVVRDYSKGVEYDLQIGTLRKLTLPKADILQFVTQDESCITIRPSGTEPKIKFYFSVKTPFNNMIAAQQQADEKIAGMKHALEI